MQKNGFQILKNYSKYCLVLSYMPWIHWICLWIRPFYPDLINSLCWLQFTYWQQWLPSKKSTGKQHSKSKSHLHSAQTSLRKQNKCKSTQAFLCQNKTEQFDSKKINILSASVAVIQFSPIDSFFSELVFSLSIQRRICSLPSEFSFSRIYSFLSALSSSLLISTTVF